jgi:hypothetical protein
MVPGGAPQTAEQAAQEQERKRFVLCFSNVAFVAQALPITFMQPAFILNTFKVSQPKVSTTSISLSLPFVVHDLSAIRLH